jgi:hypothetical protein
MYLQTLTFIESCLQANVDGGSGRGKPNGTPADGRLGHTLNWGASEKRPRGLSGLNDGLTCTYAGDGSL